MRRLRASILRMNGVARTRARNAAVSGSLPTTGSHGATSTRAERLSGESETWLTLTVATSGSRTSLETIRLISRSSVLAARSCWCDGIAAHDGTGITGMPVPEPLLQWGRDASNNRADGPPVSGSQHAMRARHLRECGSLLDRSCLRSTSRATRRGGGPSS